MGLYLSKQHQVQAQIQVSQITQTKTIKTGPKQQTTIAFSDGSKIILNSRSVLTYHLHALRGQTIKVELQGEAYFEADGNKVEFAVYTPEGIVRDIGTEFLVTARNNRSRVVVQAGKVKIKLQNEDKKGKDEQRVMVERMSCFRLMIPGS